MLDHALEEKLIDDLQELHALERRGQRRIESVLPSLEDEGLVADLRQLLAEGREHVELLAGCLSANGEIPDEPAADDAVVAPTGEDGGRGALADVYGTARAGIAGYRLLEDVAERAGDEETAEVARTILERQIAAVARLDRHPGAVAHG